MEQRNGTKNKISGRCKQSTFFRRDKGVEGGCAWSKLLEPQWPICNLLWHGEFLRKERMKVMGMASIRNKSLRKKGCSYLLEVFIALDIGTVNQSWQTNIPLDKETLSVLSCHLTLNIIIVCGKWLHSTDYFESDKRYSWKLAKTFDMEETAGFLADSLNG